METQPRRISPGLYLLGSILTAVVPPALILALAGNWHWLEGWIFSLWFDAMVLFNSVYLYTKDPALFAERTKAPGSYNQKGWDKYIQSGAYFALVLWLVIMPLDAQRFSWSPAFPVWLKAAGGIALIPAIYLIERSTIENTYLSTMVRIQAERKQRVISTGVYSFVRHPLYLGCLLMMVGAPLLLGSIAGLIIGLIAAAVLAGRIVGEEKMLASELEGYTDYQHKVKFRLIPFVW